MNQTILSTIPNDINFLSPIPYKFIIQRAPNLNFFLQECNLPGVSSQPAIQPTPFSDIPKSGVKLTWNPLFVTFKVDEQLANWQEIWSWITAINLAESFDPYASLASNPDWTNLNVTSEIILIVHDAERNPNFNVYFHNAFPIMMTDMKFMSTPDDIDYITASATFRYSHYDLEKVV